MSKRFPFPDLRRPSRLPFREILAERITPLVWGRLWRSRSLLDWPLVGIVGVKLEARLQHFGVIVTDPLQERQAASNLRSIGIKAYCPIYWTGFSKQVLFSNYCFAPITRNWRAVYVTRGCRRWLTCGEKPARIERHFIPRLRAMENRHGHIVLPPRIIPGDKVTVVSGPFEDQIGIYEGQTAAGREGVLLSLLGQEVVVPVKPHEIELTSVLERRQVSKFSL